MFICGIVDPHFSTKCKLYADEPAFCFIRCLQLLIVLVGLSSYNALGLVLRLLCYLDLKPRPSTNVGYCRRLFFQHKTLGNRRDTFILSYVVKVSKCSVIRVVNPVSS